MKKKAEILERIIKEMERLNFPNSIIDEYKAGNVLVSDNIEKKMYNTEENHKIREAANGVQFMTEESVIHVVYMETPDLGKVIVFLLAPDSVDKVDLKEDECHVYRYYIENTLYCGFGAVKLNVNNDLISLKSEYA